MTKCPYGNFLGHPSSSSELNYCSRIENIEADCTVFAALLSWLFELVAREKDAPVPRLYSKDSDGKALYSFISYRNAIAMRMTGTLCPLTIYFVWQAFIPVASRRVNAKTSLNHPSSSINVSETLKTAPCSNRYKPTIHSPDLHHREVLCVSAQKICPGAGL